MKARSIFLFGFALIFAVPSAAFAAPGVPSMEQRGRSSISGRVTNLAGDPLEGICVFAAEQGGGDWGDANTTSDGGYVITGLGAGRYVVDFSDCGDGEYLPQYYAGKDHWEDADPVPLGAGEKATGIDAAMKRGGSISGTVTDEDGTPVSTCVFVVEDAEEWDTHYGYSGDDGAYTVSALPEGDYKLQFGSCEGGVIIEPVSVAGTETVSSTTAVPPSASNTGYVGRWYKDKTSQGDAEVVHVTEGENTPGIDQSLPIAGAIAGRVTDGAGNGLGEICISAYGEAGDAWAQASDSGDYAMTGLDSGEYTVSFSDCYDSRWQSQTLEAVQVVRREITDGVDAVMVERPRPDVAVTKLRVTPVAIRTDDVVIGHNPFERTVDVEVANLGTASTERECYWWQCQPDASLTVYAAMANGQTERIGEESFDLNAGSTRKYSFAWHAEGYAGDAKVYAQVCHEDDADSSNDEMSADSYVGAGGTGIGFGVYDENVYLCDPPFPIPYDG